MLKSMNLPKLNATSEEVTSSFKILDEKIKTIQSQKPTRFLLPRFHKSKH